MSRVSDVFSFLNQIAPVQDAMSYDNVGLLVGDATTEISKIVVALDITQKVIDEAVSFGANLIVSHHPVIFEPLKSVVAGDITANHVIALIQNGISAICMHTNLDAAQGGVNDQLAHNLGISCEAILELTGENIGIGRVGRLESPMEFCAFLEYTAQRLCTGGLRYHQASRHVYRVAVGGGSCGSMLEQAKAFGCDTFVTADIKHAQWLAAQEIGLNLIDAGHFSTENVIIKPLANQLSEKFAPIEVFCAQNCTEPIQYFKYKEAHYGA